MRLRVTSFDVSLWTAAAVAIGAIVVTALTVLTGPSGQRPTVLLPPRDATPVEVDPRAVPDPSAVGVIAAQHQGQLTFLTPDGSPTGIAVPFFVQDGVSGDGAWVAGSACNQDGECSLHILPERPAQGWTLEATLVRLQGSYVTGEWAPEDSIFAALDFDGNLYLVEPRTLAARLLARDVTAYAWTAADNLLFATHDGNGGRLWRTGRATGPLLLGDIQAPVRQFFPAPDNLEFAFAQDSVEGWRLLTVRADSGRIHDFGSVERGQWGEKAVTAPAFAVAWSPDGSHLAIGPVSEPFVLHVLRVGHESRHHSFWLEKGYAGELRWSPDGSRLAISTYTPNRVWHEVFVLEMGRIEQGPRFLLDGCEIVWSPDGRHVAVKREPARASAIAAIRVDNGEYWHVSQRAGLVPVAWGDDAADATKAATTPSRRSGKLGK